MPLRAEQAQKLACRLVRLELDASEYRGGSRLARLLGPYGDRPRPFRWEGHHGVFGGLLRLAGDGSVQPFEIIRWPDFPELCEGAPIPVPLY